MSMQKLELLKCQVLKSSSFYLAYDKGDNEQRLKELAYMRQDAIDKIFAGKQEELTEDQQMLALWQTDDFAQRVYWGKKCFRQERYYEVIAYLAPVWNKHIVLNCLLFGFFLCRVEAL